MDVPAKPYDNVEWAIFSFHTRARLVIHFEGGLPGNEEKVALSEECIHPIDLTPRTRGVGATYLTCQYKEGEDLVLSFKTNERFSIGYRKKAAGSLSIE